MIEIRSGISVSRMRIFAGYGYNDRDQWVEQYVFPLLAALECEVIHGRVAYGGALPDEVMKLIRSADAMLGFTTRRESLGNDQYRTHDWVVQELLTAHSHEPRVPWVEIREEGVISPGGILDAADSQRIDYRQEDLAGCLIKIAQAVKRFHDLTRVTMIRLGPTPAAEQIGPLMDDPTFACSCQTLRGSVQLPARNVPFFPIKGGVFVQLRGVAKEDLVRITISARGRIWRSAYETVDTVDVQVKE